MSESDRRALRKALVNAFGRRNDTAVGHVRMLINNDVLTIANLEDS